MLLVCIRFSDNGSFEVFFRFVLLLILVLFVVRVAWRHFVQQLNPLLL